MLKKALSILLVFSVIMGTVTLVSNKLSANAMTFDLDFGENITYELSKEGVLTFSGKGEIERRYDKDNNRVGRN